MAVAVQSFTSGEVRSDDSTIAAAARRRRRARAAPRLAPGSAVVGQALSDWMSVALLGPASGRNSLPTVAERLYAGLVSGANRIRISEVGPSRPCRGEGGGR